MGGQFSLGIIRIKDTIFVNQKDISRVFCLISKQRTREENLIFVWKFIKILWKCNSNGADNNGAIYFELN